MSAPEKHALLSASGAHKWLHCTPSARLEETLPESTSEYAEEGRLAHAIAELKVRKLIEPMSQRTFNSRLKKPSEDPRFQNEMLRYTDTYRDHICSIVHTYNSLPYMSVEKRIDYSAYVPEGFGTGDCIIIGGDTLHVIDLKYGKGVPVSAEANPQMMLYALSAYTEYSFLFGITDIQMTIVQPRLDSISEYRMSADELLAWGESIKPVAQKAFAGKGEFVPGEHCRFCRAKALCRARAEFNTSLEEYHGMKPPLLSNEDVGVILVRAQHLAKWAKDLEEYALGECLLGNEIPGWKAVEGRSTRQFTDQEAAFTTLRTDGVEEAMLYERKPLTLAAIEKLLGKSRFTTLLSTFIETPPGKPALAPEADKREPIKRASAKDDFAEEGAV